MSSSRGDAALPRVVVLGGGMAGLVTAWELSRGDWRSRLESITVYQRGWRLGGKGASSRGLHGRIEEHGLHVLLGYYDATFRVLREVYAELDREATDPGCALRTWREALVPAAEVGLADRDGTSWSHFVTRFSGNDRVPGEPGAEDRPLRPLDVAVRALRLLADFQRAVAGTAPPARPQVRLSTSPVRRAGPADLGGLLRGGALTALAALVEVVEQAARVTTTAGLDATTTGRVAALVETWRRVLHGVVYADPALRRTWHLVDLVSTNLRGMAVDGLLSGRGYDRIDHLDYREWLARHGAAPETLDSPIVRGMYDLVFAYEEGDRSRPRFAAGLGLELSSRMLFDYKGSIFWRMQAGMGEVVFAPLHQALSRRGVQFEFFHRLDRLRVSPTDRAVVAVELTRQADLAPGVPRYEPLRRVADLPCWPDHPLADQLATDPGGDLEAHWWEGLGTGTRTLMAGADFDVAVLAVSLGMVPLVASELLDADPAWRRMVDEVRTVATQSAQLWLTADEASLGWNGAPGVTLSGFGDSFDTWASMSHLLATERWPDGSAPRSLAYLCGAMPAGPDDDPAAATDRVRTNLERFLDHEVAALWPRAVGAQGFRWGVLVDGAARRGPDRLDGQYLRANVDPSDRYVQSLPGSGRHRLAPGRTGFTNLAVAGDWTASGLPAGCLESATRSGVLAANAILSGTVAGLAALDLAAAP